MPPVYRWPRSEGDFNYREKRSVWHYIESTFPFARVTEDADDKGDQRKCRADTSNMVIRSFQRRINRRCPLIGARVEASR